MDLTESLALSIKVIADWRVIFIAVAVLLVVSALRYAGSVYRGATGPKRRAPPSAPRKAPAAKASSKGAEPEESDEGMVE